MNFIKKKKLFQRIERISSKYIKFGISMIFSKFLFEDKILSSEKECCIQIIVKYKIASYYQNVKFLLKLANKF